MTAPHELAPERRRSPLRTLLKGVGVVGLVLMFVVGIVSFLPGGVGGLLDRAGPPEVEGEILWSTDDGAVQLGPNGWLTHPGDDGGYVARNVRTGESWTIGDLASQMSITQDGVVVQPDEKRILIQSEGSTRTTSTTKILDAFGQDDLWPGTNSELVALSDTHVVVATCLAPRPSSLVDEVEGGVRVLAGIKLTDASVGWTRDTGAGCGPDVGRGKPRTVPAQQYTLVEPSDETVMAIDIDTGKVAQRWSGVSAHQLVVQGEHVLAPDGDDTVTWSSLRTGKEIARVTCRGAGAGDPGDISRQLSQEATPFVTCWESVHALDGDRFVEIPVPPAQGGVPLDEGTKVAHGHLVLEREGPTVHVRNGLTGQAVGDVDVPADFEVAGFVPQGRLLAFVQWDDSGERNTGTYRFFDARDGTTVLVTGGGMRTGADASPDGVVMVESDDEDLESTSLWVAGTKGKA